MILKYRLVAASHIGELKRYLMHGGRSLAAGLRQGDSFQDEIQRLKADATRHDGTVMSGYLSFLPEGPVPPSTALEIVDQALAESLLRPAPAIIVVHGPPLEPTAVHAHFIVTYRGLNNPSISRTVARKSLTAALADLGSQYGWTLTPGPPRRLGGTSIAGEIFRDDLTLASWIKQNLDLAALERCRTAEEFGQELAKFGLSYELSERKHGLLHDHSTELPVRASILGTSYQPGAILERFGSLPTSRKPDPEEAIATYRDADRRTRFFTDHQRAAHRKARDEWERNVQPLWAKRRSEVYAAHAKRRQDTKAYFKMLKSALPPIEEGRSKAEYHSLVAFRQRVRDALKVSREARLQEADRQLHHELSRLFGEELHKPSRFIRTWLREQQQPAENPFHIERTDGSSSAEAPWHGVPALGGGTDLFVGRKRLATQDGKTIRILDPTMDDELIATLPIGPACVVHGPDDFRQRALQAIRGTGAEATDGGADSPHYGDRNVAETALALYALGIETTVDGDSFTPQSNVFAASEVRVADDTVVAVRRNDLGPAIERVGEPDVVAGNLALFLTDSADEADELTAKLNGLTTPSTLFEPGTAIEHKSARLALRSDGQVAIVTAERKDTDRGFEYPEHADDRDPLPIVTAERKGIERSQSRKR